MNDIVKLIELKRELKECLTKRGSVFYTIPALSQREIELQKQIKRIKNKFKKEPKEYIF